MNIPVFALRNLLRHPRRAAAKIVGIAIITSVMILWGSLGRGFSELLQHNAVSLELGDLQIHHKNYLDSDSLYDTIEFDEVRANKVAKLGLNASPRLYSYALAASGNQSAGVAIRGFDLEKEKSVSDIHKHVLAGAWLDKPDGNEVVVGNTLAKILDLKVGQELIIMGQAADGSLASDRFIVKGILRLANQNIDRRAVLLPEASFRNLFMIEGKYHELALKRQSPKTNLEESQKTLEELFPEDSVMSWKQRKPVLARMIDLQGITVYFTLAFIYFALGGLILNSMIMTIFDRMPEYGIMKAIGMSPLRIVVLIFAETFWLAAIAAILATILGFSVGSYFQAHGLNFGFIVDRLSFGGMTMEPILYGVVGLKQVFAPIVFLLAMMPIAALYPALKAARVKPIDAIHGR